MASRPLVVRLSIDRRAAWTGLAALLLVGSATFLSSEQLTLTTTYPAPVGVYRQLITTGGGGMHTLLARDNGRVGIGTASPAHRLHVQGRIQATGDICTDQAGGKCLSTGGLETRVIVGPVSACRGTSTANCPAGWQVVGGGHQWLSSCGCSETFRMSVASMPSGNGWTGWMECSTSRVYAVCAR